MSLSRFGFGLGDTSSLVEQVGEPPHRKASECNQVPKNPIFGASLQSCQKVAERIRIYRQDCQNFYAEARVDYRFYENDDNCKGEPQQTGQIDVVSISLHGVCCGRLEGATSNGRYAELSDDEPVTILLFFINGWGLMFCLLLTRISAVPNRHLSR